MQKNKNFKTSSPYWDKVWEKEGFRGLARYHTCIQENRIMQKYAPKTGTIVEAGCGLGRNLLFFQKNKKVRLIGLDYSPSAVKHARAYFKKLGARAEFKIGDLRKLNLKDNSVDLIFNQGVIEHFTEPDIPVSEMIRVSKKRIIIFVPNTLSWDGLISIILLGFSKIGLYDYKHRFPYDWKKFFTKRSLSTLVESLGCEIKLATTIGVVPVCPIPARYVPRWARKILLAFEKVPLPKREIVVVADKKNTTKRNKSTRKRRK